MAPFETLLCAHRPSVERFVKFRISNRHDAEDILQETYLAASRAFDTLDDSARFKAWMLGIARNKCADYYRKKAGVREIPLDGIPLCDKMYARHTASPVWETLLTLGADDRALLYLVYYRELKQAEIARQLGIPPGTVKSRLHAAKQRFRDAYPYPPRSEQKGENNMKTLPKTLPDYTITKSAEAPFSVVWEEIMGWFLVPRQGERLSWGMYDHPARTLSESDDMEVVGRAVVHGIEGVEIHVTTHDPMDCNSEGGQETVGRTFVAQLTDTHCRLLSESHMRDGVRYHYTFLDGDAFLDNWGFGEDNCGNETHLSAKGDIVREGSTVMTKDKPFLLDIVGRYTVTINGKVYDTVCVMDAYTYNDGVVSEQYLDRNGRTILWRRFNRDDRAQTRYGKPWHEILPENECITVNGVTYVHWYDCITDYIL